MFLNSYRTKQLKSSSAIIILLGHGSLRQDSAVTMLRLAKLLCSENIMTEVAFLNFNSPTLTEVVKSCLIKGVSDIFIQPYFLIQGYYIDQALPQQVAEIKQYYPNVNLCIGKAFGYHKNFVEMVYQSFLTTLPKKKSKKNGLLLMAHGTPQAEANEPIWQVLAALKTKPEITAAQLCFMEINSPNITTGIDILLVQDVTHVSAVPYFLQFGRHVKEDLPQAIENARKQHPLVSFALSNYLSDDSLLLSLIKDSVLSKKHL